MRMGAKCIFGGEMHQQLHFDSGDVAGWGIFPYLSTTP